MPRALLAVALLLAAPAASALEPWTSYDTALEVAFAGALVADWLQTRQIARTADGPGGLEESNPLLGRRPSGPHLGGYFAAAAVGHLAVAAVLPRPWRTVWQATWIGLEGLSIRKNASLGLRVTF